MSDADEGTDEVLTPEVVDDGVPQPRTRDSAGGRPDRRPIIGLSCGIASLVFLLLIPVPLIMLTLAFAAIYLGRQVLRDVAPDDADRAKDRMRAKFGLAAGLTTLILFVILIAVLYFTYEPPDKGGSELDDKTTSEPAG